MGGHLKAHGMDVIVDILSLVPRNSHRGSFGTRFPHDSRMNVTSGEKP